MDKEAQIQEDRQSKDESSTEDLSSEPVSKHDFNEQTHYVPTSTIITVSAPANGLTNTTDSSQIFLAAASVDFLALMDQTTLAASLTIVSNALNAGDEQAWIAGAYFV